MSLLTLYRDAYTGLSRKTWYLSAVMLINRSGTMVVPFMTMYATQQLGFSIAQAGIIMGIFGVGAIVGTYLGGRLTDKIGFYKIQLFALLVGGVLFIVLGHLRSYTGICIGTFLLSMVNESFRPANSTAIAHYSIPENRTRSYSLNRLAINLGWAVGGAVGGLLAEMDYQLLFWVDGITNISAAIILFFVLPVPAKTVKTLSGEAKPDRAGTSAYRDKIYLGFICLTVLFAFCFFQLFTILPVYYRQSLRLTERHIGFLMALNGIIIALTEMVLVHSLDGKHPPLYYIKYGVVLVGISFGIFNLLTGGFLLAIISILIITVGEMLSMPFMNTFWISRSYDHNRGEYAALYSMGWASAQIAAPSIGGWVADHLGFDVLWWIILGVSLLASVGFIVLARYSAIEFREAPRRK
ncbi:MFS transporter [Segetibacter sp. 3557_3]|uniref:MFS transporter n=1 Tax=Segetibacter sp. 3557_3 TaxID=2547429 RepID=UPI00140481F8|nr:MFS transporter [Segetibacter sp. 3557_3]